LRADVAQLVEQRFRKPQCSRFDGSTLSAIIMGSGDSTNFVKVAQTSSADLAAIWLLKSLKVVGKFS